MMGLLDHRVDPNKAAVRALRRTSEPVKLERDYPAAACFKDLDLIDIPDVMDKMEFNVAAALMWRWFAGQAFTMPLEWKRTDHPMPIIPSPNFDASIVRMSWVLRYGRALAIGDELIKAASGRLSPISRQASQRNLIKNLTWNGFLGSAPKLFGIGDIQYLHRACHINSRKVSANSLEKLADPIDDLYCALGAFTMHAVAGGTIYPLNPEKNSGVTHEIRVDRIGIYIIDFYDFNGDQPLGLWSEDAVFAMPSQIKAQGKLPRWVRLTLKALFYIVIIFVSLILFLVCYLFYISLDEAKLVHTSTCGRYQLRVYEFDTEHGYLQLVDDKNKVLDELSFEEDTNWGPVDWLEDCRSVYVTGEEGRTKMRVDK